MVDLTIIDNQKYFFNYSKFSPNSSIKKMENQHFFKNQNFSVFWRVKILKKNRNQTFAIKHSSYDFIFFGCLHSAKIRHKKSIKW
jgi:hypothetical protein